MNCRRSALHLVLVVFFWTLSADCQSVFTDCTRNQALPMTPLPANNGSGRFLWPLAGLVELYEIGSTMNISWSTTFSKTNISLVPNFDWDKAVPLLENTSSTYYVWTVKCLGDCQVPWLVSAIDGEGDYDEQRSGGFVSAEFWIMPFQGDISSTSAERNKDRVEDASTGTESTSTTLIKSTITISPPRVTIMLNSSASAIATPTTTAPSNSTSMNAKATLFTPTPINNTTSNATTTLFTPYSITNTPTISSAAQSDSSSSAPMQSGGGAKGVAFDMGFLAVLGMFGGWCALRC